MSIWSRSRNSWLSSAFSSPPNTRWSSCGFASPSAFGSRDVMIVFLETHCAGRRRVAGWPLPLSRQKRKPSDDRRRRSVWPPADRGAKGLDQAGRGRRRRGEERAAPDLAGVVEERLARRVDQARARFLEQKIGGGDVPIVRVFGRDGEIDGAERRHAQAVGERRHARRDLDRRAELRRYRLNDGLGAGGGARRPAGGGGERRAVERRAAAARGGVGFVERRGMDDPGDRAPVDDERG